MAGVSLIDLVLLLRDSRLLEPDQLDEVTDRLVRHLYEPPILLDELVRRGWLTTFQGGELKQGRGRELLLGPYLLLDRLGRDALGTVFKARVGRQKRLAVLKVFAPEIVARPEEVARLGQVIHRAIHLAHSHYVALENVFHLERAYFWVMEYVDGISLVERVEERGPLPVLEACGYVRQAALGLQYLHEHGLVHRNLKPSKLLLTNEWKVVKLCDLSLARLTESTLAKTDWPVGTPGYVAPEQIRAAHQVDPRADLYSLGCTFYFLLTGRPPFAGGSLEQTLAGHLVGDVPAVEQVRPDVPVELAQALRKLLAKRPEDRFPSVANLLQVLGRLLDARPAEVARPAKEPAAGESDMRSGSVSEPSTALEKLRKKAAQLPKSPEREQEVDRGARSHELEDVLTAGLAAGPDSGVDRFAEPVIAEGSSVMKPGDLPPPPGVKGTSEEAVSAGGLAPPPAPPTPPSTPPSGGPSSTPSVERSFVGVPPGAVSKPAAPPPPAAPPEPPSPAPKPAPPAPGASSAAPPPAAALEALAAPKPLPSAPARPPSGSHPVLVTPPTLPPAKPSAVPVKPPPPAPPAPPVLATISPPAAPPQREAAPLPPEAPGPVPGPFSVTDLSLSPTAAPLEGTLPPPVPLAKPPDEPLVVAMPPWPDDSTNLPDNEAPTQSRQTGSAEPGWKREPSRSGAKSLWQTVSGLFNRSGADVDDPSMAPAARNQAASAEWRTIWRHSDISFPAMPRAGQAYNLRVQIGPAEEVLPSGEVRPLPSPQARDALMSRQVRASPPNEPRPPIPVRVTVAAENFFLEGDPVGEIIVPLEGMSPPALFRLRGESIGRGRIMVDFAQNGRPVGSVDLSCQIVRSDQAVLETDAHGTGQVGLAASPTAPPDVVITVYERRHAGQPGQLHFVLSSNHPGLRDLPVLHGDLGTQDLKCDVADWVEEQLQTLGALAEFGEVSPQTVGRALADIGCRLFEQLLPRPLQDLYWVLRQRGVQTMLVLSDEPHIPWELVKPFRTDPRTRAVLHEEPFWGETFALTHWLRGRPPAARLAFDRVFAVAAAGSEAASSKGRGTRDVQAVAAGTRPSGLAAAEAELNVVRSLETAGARVLVLPARRHVLKEALEKGDFDLLHLVCHGQFGGWSSADASILLLEDGPFSAAELSPRLAGALQRAAPLVFFNACHSGRLGFSLTRLGSWGARLVQLGCGAFIGSLWPVTDKAALAFAQVFYDGLTGGLPIGVAMTRARCQIHEQFPNDPTWLAYRCFADPLACVERVAG